MRIVNSQSHHLDPNQHQKSVKNLQNESIINRETHKFENRIKLIAIETKASQIGKHISSKIELNKQLLKLIWIQKSLRQTDRYTLTECPWNPYHGFKNKKSVSVCLSVVQFARQRIDVFEKFFLLCVGIPYGQCHQLSEFQKVDKWALSASKPPFFLI